MDRLNQHHAHATPPEAMTSTEDKLRAYRARRRSNQSKPE
jgi:hypothetical protein